MITTVVTSSPVPSNPQTRTLKHLFQSLRLVPTIHQAPKILHLDAPHHALSTKRRHAYAAFENEARRLADVGILRKTTVVRSKTFLFAAHNLAAAVALVNTSFMLVMQVRSLAPPVAYRRAALGSSVTRAKLTPSHPTMQHDFVLVRRFDADKLLRTMVRLPKVKHVRLNLRPNVPIGFDAALANFTDGDVPLSRTCGWSDAPHVASTHYYTSFVIPRNRQDHCGGARKFMEESVHYGMQRVGSPSGCWALKQKLAKGEALASLAWPADFDAYGTYLYGYASAIDGSYTKHVSLRGSGGQWGDVRPLARKGRRGPCVFDR